MSNIKLLKEPGFIYDLIYIFYLKFNTQLCIDNLPKDSNISQNTKELYNVLEQFSDISDELYIFFTANEKGGCFFTSRYFDYYKDKFYSDYNFDFVIKQLLKKEELQYHIINFYLPNLNDNQIKDCIDSPKCLYKCLKDSKYSDKLIRSIYEFFIDTDSYIQILQYELMRKQLSLFSYYEKNYNKIIEAYNVFDLNLLINEFKNLLDLSILKNVLNINVSYCLINNFCINFYLDKDDNEKAFLILGCDYCSCIKGLENNKMNPKLQSIGTALSDENRVKILELLLEKEKITCKDLEKLFSFSGSTAYHHLTIMLRNGVIKTENDGKTILYSINRDYFDAIAVVLNKFTNKK